MDVTGHHAWPYSYFMASALSDHPVFGVSWYDAVAFAQWAEKRLPTEAEWEKAARGGLEGRKYPWGDSIDKSKANLKPPFVEPVGLYSPNGYGLYDVVGNVWEWVMDGWDEENVRVLRGGSYGVPSSLIPWA